MNRKSLIILLVAIAAVVALALGLGLGLGLKDEKTEAEPPTTESMTTTSVPPGEAEFRRIDCYPQGRWGEDEVTKAGCESLGCAYEPFQGSQESYVPPCYIKEGSEQGLGYKVVSGPTDTAQGWLYNLQAKGELFHTDLLDLVTFEVQFKTSSSVRIKVYDTTRNRYEVPEDVVKIDLPTDDARLSGDLQYEVEVTSTDPFHFQVRRNATQQIIWDTSVGGLVLADQYLTLSTKLPSNNIYGFGENTHETFRHDMMFRTWPMFARDQPVGGVYNHYGVHPFYTCLEEGGNSHGVLLLNSNAMDYSLTPLPMLTYRTIGGVLDFYMFFGPTPENVIEQYTGAVGRPFLPPYWSLGFQLSRYGYNSLDNLKAAVDRTIAADIPLDVQYADIDHYDGRKVFTIDNVNFNGLPDYFDQLRADGMRTVIILDPCFVVNETGYTPYDTVKGYVKWPSQAMMPPDDFHEIGSLNMMGYVWPKGKVVFPDFLNSETADHWEDLIVSHFNDTLKFDGLWIDMNEPANFGTNEAKPWNWDDRSKNWSLTCPETSRYESPPYRTMALFAYDGETEKSRGEKAQLSDKTLCMDALQGFYGEHKHYNVHSLYGTSQIPPTLSGLQRATGERGLVLVRSTFPGSGKYGGHWLGDNASSWKHLRESIIGMLEFSLFGIPYVGADICGFFGDATPDLCQRWMQLGAFYPFARNHNGLGYRDQDPAAFGVCVADSSKKALTARYTLLPYLYTLFFGAHFYGRTVARPLMHEFPHDEETYGIDRQFLWGPSLLISPVVEEDAKTVDAYFPEGRWFDYYTGKELNASRTYRTLDAPSDFIPLHIRGGRILPTQDPDINTFKSRQNPFGLIIAPADDGLAEGGVYWDDGVSLDAVDTQTYCFFHYNYDENSGDIDMNIVTKNCGEWQQTPFLETIRVFGVKQEPTGAQVFLDGMPDIGLKPVINYNSQTEELLLTDVGLPQAFVTTRFTIRLLF